jgi:hypothetical protein
MEGGCIVLLPEALLPGMVSIRWSQNELYLRKQEFWCSKFKKLNLLLGYRGNHELKRTE